MSALLALGPQVSPAGITFNITEVLIAVVAATGAASGAWALVRKARIEADAETARIRQESQVAYSDRELKSQEVWKGIVASLRAEVDRVSTTAIEARAEASEARRGEAECVRRHDQLRAEFDHYRVDSDLRLKELEQQAEMVPVLQKVIRALTMDSKQQAELVVNDPETLRFLKDNPDGV